eukprot:752661-Hanusia_phi.AAC.2
MVAAFSGATCEHPLLRNCHDKLAIVLPSCPCSSRLPLPTPHGASWTSASKGWHSEIYSIKANIKTLRSKSQTSV